MPSDTFMQSQVVTDRLIDLPDSAPVPDLSKYTMADLRELLRGREQAPGGFLQSKDVRPGSFADSSIPGGKLSVPTISTQAELARLSLTRKPGDFCKYVDDGNGIMWVFQFRPESGVINQWEYVYGQPVHVATATSSAIPLSAAWQYTTSSGPSYFVPFNGWYMVEHTTQPYAPSVGGVLYEAAAAVDGVPPAYVGYGIAQLFGGDNRTVPAIETVDVTSGVGSTICIMYRNNNGAGVTMNVTNRNMVLRPMFIRG